MGIEDFSKKQEKISDSDLIKKINENLKSIEKNRKPTEEVKDEKNEHMEQVETKEKPAVNKKKFLNNWKKILYTGGFGLAASLSVGGLIQKSNGNPEKTERVAFPKNNEVVNKIENFNQVSDYVDTNYYRKLEQEKNYTAELNYLKRADSLEKGEIIGKNLVINRNKSGNGYDAYFIDNENRVVDSIINMPGMSIDYITRNIGGDIVIKDDNTTKNVEMVLGVKFPEKITSFLKPIGTRKERGDVIEYINSHVTVTPMNERINGKIAVIGNMIEGDFIASPIKFVTERKFRKELKNIVKKRMPSDFTLIKQALLGNESTDTKNLNYELKCSIGHACGPYQIIPYWHFFRILLDYASKEDLDFFIKHPSVQDMTFRLYIKALIDKHGDDIKSIAADYFHGNEGVQALKNGEGSSVTDGFGTNVDSYVSTFLKAFRGAVEKAKEKLVNVKEEEPNNEKDTLSDGKFVQK